MHLLPLLSCAFVALLSFAVAAPHAETTENVTSTVESRGLVHGHPDRKPRCAEGVHIIAVSGIGSAHDHAYGLLASTVKSIENAIPHSRSYALNYPKQSTEYEQSTTRGQHLLVGNIEWYAKGCPHVPIVMLGYSEGAMINMNSLCGRSGGPSAPRLPMKYHKNVIAAVVMGDETFVPHQSYDRGTCKNGHGVAARTNAHQCQPWASKIRSFCDYGDSECCVGTGSHHNAHHTYATLYDRTVTEFIVGKHKAWKRQHHHH